MFDFFRNAISLDRKDGFSDYLSFCIDCIKGSSFSNFPCCRQIQQKPVRDDEVDAMK